MSQGSRSSTRFALKIRYIKVAWQINVERDIFPKRLAIYIKSSKSPTKIGNRMGKVHAVPGKLANLCEFSL